MKRLGWLISAAALAAVLAAGCGGPAAPAPPSPSGLVAGMKDALAHATSVRMKGTVASAGQTFSMDLSMTRSGELPGHLAVGAESFTVLVTGGKTYIKVDAGFLKYIKAPAGTCAVVCNKYLLAPGSLSSGLTGGIGWPNLVEQPSKEVGASKLATGGTGMVNGQPARMLRAPHGSTRHVAAKGTPYLLRIVAPPGQTGRIDFTEWNHATILPPPPASEVIDLSQILG